jgi:hypothetical protein
MSERTTREILEDVAAGRLDPEEASRLLDDVPDDAGPAPETADITDIAEAGISGHEPTDEPTDVRIDTPPPMVAEIGRVLVRATSRRVRVIGDASVATVAIEGPHTVRRDASTLVVTGETEMVPTDDAFLMLAGGRWREVADQLQQNLGRDLELLVRVRPDLPIGVEVIAGSMSADDALGLDHVRVTAGSARIKGAVHPVDLLVQAGSAQVETRQAYGRSRMRCESGSMTLTLAEGADARIRQDVQLGRFTTQPERRGRNRDRDVVVGTGAAEIDVEVMMGTVTVRTPGWDE